MSELLQLLPWATVLIVFFGMMLLVWRALGIAHDLATLALQARAQVEPAPPQGSRPVSGPPASKPEVAADQTAVDQGLVDFIKKQEGFKANAYWDYKQYSIGYGTKASSAAEVITQAEAEARLRKEIAAADALVTAKFPNLPKGQHQALIDLTYNAGSGWEEASLGKAVAAQKIETIKADILQYNHAGGAVNAGLTARREAEVSWFDNPL
jgi:GH24 family phage-related lysozyme (muramidase)